MLNILLKGVGHVSGLFFGKGSQLDQKEATKMAQMVSALEIRLNQLPYQIKE